MFSLPIHPISRQLPSLFLCLQTPLPTTLKGPLVISTGSVIMNRMVIK